MPANLKLVINRLYELRDQLDAGELLDSEAAVSVLELLKISLEDLAFPTTEEVFCAMALLCSRQANLFEPLARVSLRTMVIHGVRISHEVAMFSLAVLQSPEPQIELDELATNWLKRDFITKAVWTQDILDEPTRFTRSARRIHFANLRQLALDPVRFATPLAAGIRSAGRAPLLNPQGVANVN